MVANMIMGFTDPFDTLLDLQRSLETTLANDWLQVRVKDNVLKVDGKLDFSKYRGLQPLYTECNVRHFSRSFRLSGKIDQNKIAAELKDGVLSLMPPLAEKASHEPFRSTKAIADNSWVKRELLGYAHY